MAKLKRQAEESDLVASASGSERILRPGSLSGMQMQSGSPNDTIALALLRWNHLNPPSRVETWITLGILVVGAIWAFWPVVAKWWRERG